MKVTKIDGDTVILKNTRGKSVDIDLRVLYEDSWSATYFDHKVPCNMTQLSDILTGAKDTIFCVSFTK